MLSIFCQRRCIQSSLLETLLENTRISLAGLFEKLNAQRLQNLLDRFDDLEKCDRIWENIANIIIIRTR